MIHMSLYAKFHAFVETYSSKSGNAVAVMLFRPLRGPFPNLIYTCLNNCICP